MCTPNLDILSFGCITILILFIGSNYGSNTKTFSFFPTANMIALTFKEHPVFKDVADNDKQRVADLSVLDISVVVKIKCSVQNCNTLLTTTAFGRMHMNGWCPVYVSV